MAAELKYPAFISYSHQDKKWADWLHPALENYRVPKTLLVAQGSDGPIPRRLFPIYRDRAETPATADLQDYVRNALEQSAHLIVICSPSSRQSKWVNQEIMTFKRLGRESQILALIVEGEPNENEVAEGSSARECFPDALRFKLGSNGELSSERIEPAAADARPHADGKENAKLKLIAGLLGVNYGALKQRELEAAKRRTRNFQIIAAVMFVLALFATAGGFLAYHFALRSEAMAESAVAISATLIDQAVSLSTRFGVTQSAINKFLVSADARLEDLYKNGVRSPGLDRQRQKVLLLFAKNFETTGDTARALKHAKDAEKMARELVRRFPQNLDDKGAFADSTGEVGDLQMEIGEVPLALASYRASLNTYAELAVHQPTNAHWKRMTARRLSDIGWVYEQQDELDGALREYRSALAIRSRVWDAEKNDVGIEHEYFASLQNIGALLLRQGKFPEALSTLLNCLTMAKRVADFDPGNSKWQSDYAIVHESTGDAQFALGQLAPALESYRASLEIRQRLAQSDIDNVDWQYEISALQLRIGDVLRLQDARRDAQSAYSATISILERLLKHDSKNAEWIRNRYIAIGRLGDLKRLNGDFEGARNNHELVLAIAKQLAATNASNMEWVDDVASFECDIGDDLAAEHQFPLAIQEYQGALSELLLVRDPRSVTSQMRIDMANAEMGIGDTLRQEGSSDPARPHLLRALQIRQQLASFGMSEAKFLHDQAIGEYYLALTEFAPTLTDQQRVHISSAVLHLKKALSLAQSNLKWLDELRRAELVARAIHAT